MTRIIECSLVGSISLMSHYRVRIIALLILTSNRSVLHVNALRHHISFRIRDRKSMQAAFLLQLSGSSCRINLLGKPVLLESVIDHLRKFMIVVSSYRSRLYSFRDLCTILAQEALVAPSDVFQRSPTTATVRSSRASETSLRPVPTAQG